MHSLQLLQGRADREQAGSQKKTQWKVEAGAMLHGLPAWYMRAPSNTEGTITFHLPLLA
jgi:hypothetical protein